MKRVRAVQAESVSYKRVAARGERRDDPPGLRHAAGQDDRVGRKSSTAAMAPIALPIW